MSSRNLLRSFPRFPPRALTSRIARRQVAAQARTNTPKEEGDISSVFASLSGQDYRPLPQRFADLKGRLIAGREDKIVASWGRLLRALRQETKTIAALGSDVIPQIKFADIERPSKEFNDALRKRGVCVIRGVVPRDEARSWKDDVEAYVRRNPWTKAFPPDKPAVYELYWSLSQLRGRLHPHMLATQRFLMTYWHSNEPSAPISSIHPVSYADRLRIRQPGDAQFALGPHMDGGGVERWEDNGYGLGHVYDAIFEGSWEEYDPWESSCRLGAVMNNYESPGGCSMFRMYQGWLSMSDTGPHEGTLKVNPLLRLAAAYMLLRPFFVPVRSATVGPAGSFEGCFLEEENWKFEKPISSKLEGASPGKGQEFNEMLHPHLILERAMVHVPRVEPGDYVAWHCDTIHAVDAIHAGTSDSSVLYIPACPLTPGNTAYLKDQRDAFLAGTPGPDFPGGKGESEHAGRPNMRWLKERVGVEGMRAFGLERWDTEEAGLTEGEREVCRKANQILRFREASDIL